MTALEEKVRKRVNAIVDPETGLTFGEMKLITELKERDPGVIRIDFRPTSSFCPIALKFALDIKDTTLKVDGVEKALVYCQGHMIEEEINRIINEGETDSQKKQKH
jgi:metal-sulfur cluster biosynthetic enzyme